MAFTSDAARRRAGRRRANAAPAAKHETAGPGRRRAAERLSLSQLPESSQASQDVAAISRQESGEEKLGLLWADIEDQMLALLAQGLAAPFQRSAFNKPRQFLSEFLYDLVILYVKHVFYSLFQEQKIVFITNFVIDK